LTTLNNIYIEIDESELAYPPGPEQEALVAFKRILMARFPNGGEVQKSWVYALLGGDTDTYQLNPPSPEVQSLVKLKDALEARFGN